MAEELERERDSRDRDEAAVRDREGREAQRTFRQEMTQRLDKLAENTERLSLAYERLAASVPTRKEIEDACEKRLLKEVFEAFKDGVDARFVKLEARPDAARNWIALGLTIFALALSLLANWHR